MIALLALALLPAFSPATELHAVETRSIEVTDAEAHAAYEALSAEDRHEIVEWFTAEIGYTGTFQGQLVSFLVDGLEDDPGLTPAAPQLEWFDPETYSPRQPIPRHWVAADSPRLKKQRKRFLPVPSSQQSERAWSWHWPTGTMAQGTQVDSDDRVFRNALRGFMPDYDLAHAILVGRLDGGDERTVLAAFGHAYTDRGGSAFPGLTLYDAWNAGTTIETPDVDILGILVSCEGKQKLKAPIPDSKHKRTYARVGVLFQRGAGYRKLREVLADTYFEGEPFDRYGYGGVRLNFQGLWESVSSDPAGLMEDLPDSKGSEKWFKKLAKRCKNEAFWNRALVRRDRLTADKVRIRATLIRILTEFGALKKR